MNSHFLFLFLPKPLARVHSANSQASVKLDGPADAAAIMFRGARTPDRKSSALLRCTGNSAGILFGGKKGSANFFFSCRSPIEAIASGWRARAFVLILTLSGFRKIVGTQRQKIDAHSLGENA